MHTILGVEDSVNTCDCCGRTGLKYTVAVSIGGDVLHYGSVCVTRHTGKSSAAVRKEARDAREQRLNSARKTVETHPSYAAYQSRMDAARKLNLLSTAFMEYCRVEREAQHTAQSQIALQSGFKFYELHV